MCLMAVQREKSCHQITQDMILTDTFTKNNDIIAIHYFYNKIYIVIGSSTVQYIIL